MPVTTHDRGPRQSGLLRRLFSGWSALHSVEGPKGTFAIARLAVQLGLKAQITRMAAALAYRTIFSLIPVLVLAFVVFGTSRGGREQMRTMISNVLQFSGISDIVVHDAEAAPIERKPVPPTSPEALEAAIRGRPDPGSAQEAGEGRVDQLITDLVNRVRRVPFATIGIVGLATLIYAALSMLVEVERAFNQIYRAPAGRTWARRLTQYWTLLTLGPLLLFTSFIVSEQFISWIRNLAPIISSKGLQDSVLGAAGFFSTVIISTLMFVIIYATVPNTRVRLRPALCGAFCAAVLWEMSKWGFRGYIGMAGTTRLYGALAMVPLFLFWVYCTWLVVLAGLQLAYAAQTYASAKAQGAEALARLIDPEADLRPSIVDTGVALPLVTVIAQRFAQGRSAGARELAQEFSITEPVTLDLLGRLTDAGVVHLVEKPDEERSYVLARPPEAISAESVLRAADLLQVHAGRTQHPELVRSLAEARIAAVKDRTIADLAAIPETGHPKAAPGVFPAPIIAHGS